MATDWQELTELTGGKDVTIERVRLTGSGIAMEGEFDLPPLAKLPSEEQVFVAAFVRCHGSIKQMEKLFGISYPTVKSRLNRIADRLVLLDIEAPPPREEVLDRLERGELSASEALQELRR